MTAMTGIQLIDNDLDIKVVKDSEGKIVSGLVLSDTLPQNQAMILQLHKGELKDDISVGVGIADILLDSGTLAWKSEIREQMEMDGQTVDSVEITNDSIIINSRY